MKKQSRTVPRRRQSVSPTPRHLPLVDILIDTQAELQELVVASGLKVLEAMLEEDRAAVCGPRYAHQPARQASRTGHTPSQVVLGGRKVAIRRPRARRAGEEVPLPTARAFANADPLNRRVVDQMLIGVATRQYARSLEPLGADVPTRGTSKRAVSRRFVAQTQAQLDAWRATPLDALDLVGLLIDGVHVGGHGIVVALGIDKMGAKHPLGLWEGATENATVCQGLLTNLASRGLRTDVRITRNTRVRETRIRSRIRSRAWTLRWPSPWNGERARSLRMAASSCASDSAGVGPRRPGPSPRSGRRKQARCA